MERTVEENKKLCEEMPYLVPHNRWTGKVPDDYDYSYTELEMAEIPQGWDNLFYNFCLELKDILNKYNDQNRYHFMQVKEKWGQLTIYENGIGLRYEKEYNDLMHKYVSLSKHTCYECGSTNAKMTYAGYIIPCCKECWDKSEYNEISFEEATDTGDEE